MRGCFARWLSGKTLGKRAVKHGKSGLRAAICALSGTLRGDLCKTVEKLCKSLQGVKTKITNCAQRFVRLCVLVRELCKYRFLSAFDVWALWCGGAPFGRFPSRLRRRGAHLGGGGAAVGGQVRGTARGGSAIGGQVRGTTRGGAGGGGQVRVAARGGVRLCLRPPPPCARHFAHQRAKCTAVGGLTRGERTALRPSAGGGSVLGGLTRGERTGRAGITLCTSAFAHSDSAVGGRGTAVGGQVRGTARGGVRLCPRPPPPCARRRGTRATTARPLSHSGADTPGSGRRANDILYIRVRRREGENVLHRAASNDVDNFSVDNPLWITAAAGGRNLRGRRRRVCGGSVNADAEV